MICSFFWRGHELIRTLIIWLTEQNEARCKLWSAINVKKRSTWFSRTVSGMTGTCHRDRAARPLYFWLIRTAIVIDDAAYIELDRSRLVGSRAERIEICRNGDVVCGGHTVP